MLLSSYVYSSINSNLLSSVIDPLEDLSEASFADPLLLCEHDLRVDFLHKIEIVRKVFFSAQYKSNSTSVNFLQNILNN